MDGWQTLSAEVDAILSASGLAPDAADERGHGTQGKSPSRTA